MNRILVLSPSEDRAGRALTLASALAERSGAALLVLRVLEESVSGDLGGSTARDELRARWSV